MTLKVWRKGKLLSHFSRLVGQNDFFHRATANRRMALTDYNCAMNQLND